jgi:hypothetical protein
MGKLQGNLRVYTYQHTTTSYLAPMLVQLMCIILGRVNSALATLVFRDDSSASILCGIVNIGSVLGDLIS